MPRTVRISIFVVALFCSARLAQAGELTLAWDPPSDSVTVGYVVQYGVASGAYTSQIDVGGATTYTVAGLTAGQTYFFVVRAYDVHGVRSEPSAEVSAVVPPTPDTIRPTITITQPANGATVSGVVSIAATATDNVGVASVRFTVDGVTVATDTTSPYNATWNSALVPNGAHYSIAAIATDAAGNSSSFTTTVGVNNVVSPPPPPPGPPGGESLFADEEPAVKNYNDGKTYELGVRVRASVPGQITAIRFWKGSAETGTHVGRVWKATGELLATVTFTNETASGWQQQSLPIPVTVLANTDYIVSVTTSADRRFSYTRQYFKAPLASGSLMTAVGAGRFGAVGVMPTKVNNNTNYFRDLVFVPAK